MPKRRTKQAPKAKGTKKARQTIKSSEEVEVICDLGAKLKRKRKNPDTSVEVVSPPKKQAKLDDNLEQIEEEGMEVVTDMKALEADLKKSYVKEYTKWKAEQAKQNPPPKLPKRATWKYSGAKPLNDMAKLPKGWTWDEPDLDKL